MPELAGILGQGLGEQRFGFVTLLVLLSLGLVAAQVPRAADRDPLPAAIASHNGGGRLSEGGEVRWRDLAQGGVRVERRWIQDDPVWLDRGVRFRDRGEQGLGVRVAR
jgi:hypothetical protein